MATTINMARVYGCRPSEIVGLTDYAAYCFDEAAFYLLAEVKRDEEGRPQWERLKWAGDKPKGNKDFIQFVQRQRGR